MSEYYNLKNEVLNISEDQFSALYGPLPPRERDPNAPLDRNTLLCETQHTFAGRFLLKMIRKQMKGMVDPGDESGLVMMEAMVSELPIRAMVMLGGDKLPTNFLDAFLLMVNGKFFKGLIILLKK